MPAERYFKNAYCLFCRTGSEQVLARKIEQDLTGVKAIAAVQEKHKFINGHYEIDRRVFLPGYLFLFSDEEITDAHLKEEDNAYHLLGDTEQTAKLKGYDREFADWLYLNDGVIGISKVRKTDGKMYVVSGPMKHFAKRIERFDKHTRNALIRMRFMDKETSMWLAFEFEDEE